LGEGIQEASGPEKFAGERREKEGIENKIENSFRKHLTKEDRGEGINPPETLHCLRAETLSREDGT